MSASVAEHGTTAGERDWLAEIAHPAPPSPAPAPTPAPVALSTELALVRAELSNLRASVEASRSQPSEGVLAASALVELQAEVARLREEVSSLRAQLAVTPRDVASPRDVAAVAGELAELRALLLG